MSMIKCPAIETKNRLACETGTDEQEFNIKYGKLVSEYRY
jgi:hypothetical protein